MDTRLGAIGTAILDMPAPAKPLLETSYRLHQDLERLKTTLNGDETRAQRQFETLPGIRSRIADFTSGMNTTLAPVPQTYKDSYTLAAKQFTALLGDLKKMDQETNGP